MNFDSMKSDAQPIYNMSVYSFSKRHVVRIILLTMAVIAVVYWMSLQSYSSTADKSIGNGKRFCGPVHICLDLIHVCLFSTEYIK